MRILVFGRDFPDSFTRNIVVSLRDMGHEVALASRLDTGFGKRFRLRFQISTYAEKFIPGLERRIDQRAVAAAVAHRAELVLTIDTLHPDSLRELRQQLPQAMIVHWMTDAVTGFGRQYVLAGDYDALFFKDAYEVEFAREKLGRRAYMMPQACNPKWHRRPVLSDADRERYGCDLTVAGNLYWYRALMLEPFIDYDMKIWGANCPPWLSSPIVRHYQNHFVAEHEKAVALNAAKIVLNTMHFAEILAAPLRVFETAGCGAFQICDWRPNLHEFLEPEQEVVTFKSCGELKEKVDYYLEHADERQKIADAGYARAQRDHSYQNRLEKILAWTFDGGPADGSSGKASG